ncbi:MAG: amino acid--tRNA ligase-related protein [Planctomycetota bacterium]
MTKQNQDVTEDQPPEAPPEATESGRKKLLADRRRKLDRLRDEFGLDPYGQRIDGLISLAEARAAYDEAADDAHRAADAAVREAKKAGTPEDQWPEVPDDRAVVSVAGRVMQHRVMGNLIFMSLRDDTADLQVAISKKAVGQPAFGIAKAVDLSDIVAVRGSLGKTNTGELTVWSGVYADAEQSEASGTDPLQSGFCFQTKSLALPPGKHHGLTDPETRYRKRYVDLHTNPQVMDVMKKRIQIIDAMRDYLRDKGYMEVETPMLQALHGGAAARPFKTHHNALDLPLTMRIAPELYLKRLLVGGMRKVFEINRNFRNEGISPRHNPEFTMLEAYDAYGDWQTMADMVEDMVCTVAEQVIGTLKIEHKDEEGNVVKTIDLTRPWKRQSMVDLVEERTGWKFDKRSVLKGSKEGLVALFRCFTSTKNSDEVDLAFAVAFVREATAVPEMLDQDELEFFENLLASIGGEEELIRMTSAHEDFEQKVMARGVTAFPAWLKEASPAEQLTEVYEKLIEPTLIDPCFVTRVPGVIIPLAKRCKDDDYFADVYELAINGVEISPGYTELNDPDIQEHHFREQVGDEEEQQQIDEDFLEALRVGMPPAGGIGLGIDRLVMMLTGAQSIRDVILFPLMRPQGRD